MLDQVTNLANLGGCILHQQGIGTLIDSHATAIRQQVVLFCYDFVDGYRTKSRLVHVRVDALDRMEQVSNVFSLGVTELDQFGSQRFEFDHFAQGLVLASLLLVDFISRRYANDVSFLAHTQVLGLQNQVERLVPGHVIEA